MLKRYSVSKIVLTFHFFQDQWNNFSHSRSEQNAISNLKKRNLFQTCKLKVFFLRFEINLSYKDKVVLWWQINSYCHQNPSNGKMCSNLSALQSCTVQRRTGNKQEYPCNENRNMQRWLSTCRLTGFFWLFNHVIYFKLTRVL